MIRKRIFAALAAATLVTAGVVTAAAVTGESAAVRPTAAAVPAFDHIVLVMFENKKYSSINGSSSAPYFTTLASQSAKFTNSFAITHPSQPNYVALFSGATQGVTDDSCPANLGAKANLGRQLIDAGKTFKGYSEAMPSDGYTGCSSGTYRRKHNSWVDFSNVPAASNVRFSGFPSDFTQLPTVSFVTPDMCNDMHDCSIGTGDTWLSKEVPKILASKAYKEGGALFVTFDESAGSDVPIGFIALSPLAKPGYSSSVTYTHSSTLRSVQEIFGVTPLLGDAANATNLSDLFKSFP